MQRRSVSKGERRVQRGNGGSAPQRQTDRTMSQCPEATAGGTAIGEVGEDDGNGGCPDHGGARQSVWLSAATHAHPRLRRRAHGRRAGHCTCARFPWYPILTCPTFARHREFHCGDVAADLLLFFPCLLRPHHSGSCCCWRRGPVFVCTMVELKSYIAPYFVTWRYLT